jgi:excisionase family DNA binding protein
MTDLNARAGGAVASLLTAKDLATKLGVTTGWIYAAVRAGAIPYVRLGRYVRFRAESIDWWLSEIERGNIPQNPKRRGDGCNPPPGMAPKE